MKKKVMVIAMAAAVAMSLCACGGTKKEETGTASAEVTTEAKSEAEDTAASESQAEETSAETAKNKGVLVMATNAEFPPYEYREGDEIVGIDVEIAKAIAEKMGMELEIEDMMFDSIIPAVQSGKADFGAAGMTSNEDRKQSIDFSDTYAAATQVVIVKADSGITGMDVLAGKVVGVQQGTTGDLYVSEDEEIGIKEVERYTKGFEAVQALLQNKIDAVVIDGEPAKIFVSQNDGLLILDEAYTDEEYAICVKKGNTELLESINEAIAQLKASGELEAIVDKYISAE